MGDHRHDVGTIMSEKYERYTIENEAGGVRISFDQNKNAVVNLGFGLVLAVAGYLWDASLGTVVMWVGVAWALLAARAYNSDRVTEVGEDLSYRNGRKTRTMSRADLTELVLRLKRRARRTAKQSVLPWSVEIWGDDRKPFASYTFQAEGPARAFASRLGDALDLTPTERVEPAD